jgi:hypothetical protein
VTTSSVVISASWRFAESGKQVAIELRAVEIERPVAPLAGRCLHLELGEPAARDLGEGEPG